MKKTIIPSLAISLLLFVSCKTDFDRDVNNMTVSSGTANFTKYVSIGNSLTSGYRDGALYLAGQNESYPSMIAQQMKLTGGAQTFLQPLMADNLGGIPAVGFNNKLVLTVQGGSLTPAYATGTATNTIANIYSAGPYNNMGVPGAKSYHLVAPGYGDPANLAAGKANPYFVRFASTPSTTILADAMAQKPTFYSLWIGNNDVLSYATSGGMGVDQTGNVNPATYGSNDISDPNVVAGVIKNVILGLKSVNSTAQGVIANIPNVTSIPYFTTVPYNAIPLDAATATAVNQLYAPVKQVLTAYGQGSRLNLASAGNNPVLIYDKDLTDMSAQITGALTAGGLNSVQAAAIGSFFGKARQATAEDHIVLPAMSVLGKNPASNPAPFDKLGVTAPLNDQYVLSKNETAKVTTAVSAYNTAIASLASTYGLALVDANSKMVELSATSGIQFDGVKYTAKFVTGGSFSLDGVHPTGRGYAVLANEFIKAINIKFASNLPFVNVNSYSGVQFP